MCHKWCDFSHIVLYPTMRPKSHRLRPAPHEPQGNPGKTVPSG
ncbi:hypothetical protein HMPREF9278_2001 [Mobiluncus mulieris FB024-16]|nr:hypothetical protein HMPREF9278_2001 [Mobiluncus mulieris FB024-16]